MRQEKEKVTKQEERPGTDFSVINLRSNCEYFDVVFPASRGWWTLSAVHPSAPFCTLGLDYPSTLVQYLLWWCELCFLPLTLHINLLVFPFLDIIQLFLFSMPFLSAHVLAETENDFEIVFRSSTVFSPQFYISLSRLFMFSLCSTETSFGKSGQCIIYS